VELYYLVERAMEVVNEPLFYQILLTLSFVVFINKILVKKMNDNNIPIIPRIFYVKEKKIFNKTLPIKLEFVKEFLNTLQEKRNSLLAELRNGTFLKDHARNKIKELAEVEKRLYTLLLCYFKCDYFNKSSIWIYYHNFKKVFKTYLSILMKIN